MASTGRWSCAHTDPVELQQLSDPTAWKSLVVVGQQSNTSVELPEWSPGPPGTPPQSPKRLLTPILAPLGLAMAPPVSPGECAGP